MRFLLALCTLLAAELPAQQNGYFGSIGYQLQSSSQQVKGVPAALRTVPIHKDDGSDGSGQRLIPKDSVDLFPWHLFNISFGPEFTRGSAAFRFGGTAAFPIQGYSPTSRGVQSWAQFVNNDQRGVGTSLVFWSLKPQWVLPGVFGEVQLGKKRGVIAGYSLLFGALSYRTGWDRYNELETYQRSTSRMLIKHPYAGVMFLLGDGAHLRLLGGPSMLPEVRMAGITFSKPVMGFNAGVEVSWSSTTR